MSIKDNGHAQAEPRKFTLDYEYSCGYTMLLWSEVGAQVPAIAAIDASGAAGSHTTRWTALLQSLLHSFLLSLLKQPDFPRRMRLVLYQKLLR